jgi:hypothetical protein
MDILRVRLFFSLMHHNFNMKHFLLLWLLLFSLPSFSQSYRNGKYCANVSRYNPATGKNSEYRLPIYIQNGTVTRIDWPNDGGYIASSEGDFTAPIIHGNRASFVSKTNNQFAVEILGVFTEKCFAGVPIAKQCTGITKKGDRCKNMTDNSNQRCHLH